MQRTHDFENCVRKEAIASFILTRGSQPNLIFKLLVGIAITLPFRCTTASIEDWRKLVAVALAYLFPTRAKQLRQSIRDRERKCRVRFLYARKNSLLVGGVIVHHIKNLALNTGFQPSKDDCFSTIIHISQWQ